MLTPDIDRFSDSRRPPPPPPPPHTVKLHILEWPFIVVSLRHNCAIIMLSNQHVDMPHGGWIISANEVLTYTDLDRIVNNI